MQKKSGFISKIFLVLRVLVPIVLIYFLFKNLDWQNLGGILRSYPIDGLVLAILASIVANILFAFRWYYLIRTVDINISPWYLIRLMFYSLFLSNFLPTTIGGDLVKIAGITLNSPIGEKSIRISTVVADRIFSLVSKIILIPLVLIFKPAELLQNWHLPLSSSSVIYAKLPERLRTWLGDYLRSIKPWFKAKPLFLIFCISFGSLFFTILSQWILIQRLNPFISFAVVFFIAILTYFVTILPISINGLGVQEGSYTLLLMQAGMSYDQALTSAILIRFVTLSVSAIGGLLFLTQDRDLWNVVQGKYVQKESVDETLE